MVPIFILCFLQKLSPSVPDGNVSDLSLIRENEALINALMLDVELSKNLVVFGSVTHSGELVNSSLPGLTQVT